MRIAILAGNYTRASETFVYEPLQWLTDAGHEVALIARRARALPGDPARPLPRHVLGDPAPAAAVAAALARAPIATLRAALRGWPHRRARGFRLAAGLRDALVSEIRGADALIAHYGPTGVQFLSVALLAQRPYAVYFHGYDVGRVLADDPLAYETLFRSGASLLTNSDFLRERLVGAGASPERVCVVPLGVDPRVAQAVREPASPPRLLTIARLVPKKGLEDALRAFARLRAHADAWHYDIVGDGPLRGALGQLAEELEISDRVRFHGFLSREDTIDALRRASVFLLASRVDANGSTEGTPVALLEAASLGVPVVATQHAGIPEILPPQARSEGFLADSGDVAALGDALARLARDATSRESWGRACAAHVALRHSAKAHVEALTDALSRHARVPELREAAVPELHGATGPAGARRAAGARRPLRVGIVANEFFERASGRIGGFGWAAANAARSFRETRDANVEVVFLTGERGAAAHADETRVHDTPLLLPTRDYAERVRRLDLDLLLLIDYRRGYRRVLDALPRVPFILWSRDPWDAGDRAALRTLRIPGAADAPPSGYERPVDASLREVARRARWRRRRWLVATTTPWLGSKVADAYGVTPARVHWLPNPIPPGPTSRRAARPTVLWLGRLDAIKRPWLVVDVARRLPDVEFRMAGDAYVEGPLRWQPAELPPNVRLVGHLEGKPKEDALASAWLLLGTSIHEGLPVSFLEAFAAGLPIVSCQDPEGVVSRFGRAVVRCDGSGEDAVPDFAKAIAGLVSDTEERERLGNAAREWVAATHSRERFLLAFRALASELTDG
ncbi:MAG TPA: glycosyltransferase, partial [Myxococcota bacterium]|nr:glycosyltransferase [Myxococcota bacterium]